jgi:hypothetical protein
MPGDSHDAIVIGVTFLRAALDEVRAGALADCPPFGVIYRDLAGC